MRSSTVAVASLTVGLLVAGAAAADGSGDSATSHPCNVFCHLFKSEARPAVANPLDLHPDKPTRPPITAERVRTLPTIAHATAKLAKSSATTVSPAGVRLPLRHQALLKPGIKARLTPHAMAPGSPAEWRAPGWASPRPAVVAVASAVMTLSAAPAESAGPAAPVLPPPVLPTPETPRLIATLDLPPQRTAPLPMEGAAPVVEQSMASPPPPAPVEAPVHDTPAAPRPVDAGALMAMPPPFDVIAALMLEAPVRASRNCAVRPGCLTAVIDAAR